jgi:hypothetical protein
MNNLETIRAAYSSVQIARTSLLRHFWKAGFPAQGEPLVPANAPDDLADCMTALDEAHTLIKTLYHNARLTSN